MTNTKLSPLAKRCEQLLLRYPDIDADETDEIVQFLKKGSHLEIGLLGARDGVRPQLEAFKRDHRKRFALGPREYALFLLMTLTPLAAICWYVWGRVNAA